MVGHCENSLMPSRSSGDWSTLTVSYSETNPSRICTTWAENPHCGARRSPFMKRTMRFRATRSEICARRDSFIWACAPLVRYAVRAHSYHEHALPPGDRRTNAADPHYGESSRDLGRGRSVDLTKLRGLDDLAPRQRVGDHHQPSARF